MLVRTATAADAVACRKIVGDLPDYFTEDVPGQIEADLASRPGWVILDHDDVIGFAIADLRPPSAAEILWMAVRTDRRNGGHGTTLLAHVLGDLRDEGVAVVEAKTLDAAAGYEPYVATRAFWERNGFVQVDTIDPLPGWQPGNPSAIYVCALSATR